MKQWLFISLIVLFALVFTVSACFLLNYYQESQKQKSSFDELAQIMNQATIPPTEPPQTQLPDSTDPAEPTAQPEPEEPVFVKVTDPQTGEVREILPEFAELYAMNNHIVGWISIENTNINYPVMQTPNVADFYLYKDYNQEYSRHGCIYVREVCDVFAPSDNITIYGHRMGDGTMFNDLHKYADKDFYNNHNIITFNTLTARHTYEIISIFRISSTVDHPFQYHLFVDASDAAHFDAFIDNCNAYSLYDTGVTASYGDKLITLSTCEYTQLNGRLVVVAKCIA